MYPPRPKFKNQNTNSKNLLGPAQIMVHSFESVFRNLEESLLETIQNQIDASVSERLGKMHIRLALEPPVFENGIPQLNFLWNEGNIWEYQFTKQFVCSLR